MATTIAEELRSALTSIRKKKRAAVRYDTQAYRKAYGIKGGKNGNISRRRKGKAPATQTVDGSEQEIGRGTGELGAGS